MVPYSKITMVKELFGLTIPFKVAEFSDTFVAEEVVTTGAFTEGEPVISYPNKISGLP